MSQPRSDFNLALKFNNTASRVSCYCCDGLVEAEVGYAVTLCDTYDFLCEDCVANFAPELIAACDMANDVYWEIL